VPPAGLSLLTPFRHRFNWLVSRAQAESSVDLCATGLVSSVACSSVSSVSLSRLLSFGSSIGTSFVWNFVWIVAGA
jgi:hypothetical protein